MTGFTTLRLADVEARRDDTGAEWLPVRHALGISAFGINAWRARRAGVEVIERHDEATEGEAQAHQEAYLVLEGAARFTVDGTDVDAPAGTVVFVEDPALERAAVATEDGTLVLALGAQPGVAFGVSAWEQRALDPA
ncbi:MAG TPA: hypothetical protein VES79_02345 [Solirubrobacteraceae bacterium]|nr:hypothetical protein [Solirubrobacteraceae bacterium]